MPNLTAGERPHLMMRKTTGSYIEFAHLDEWGRPAAKPWDDVVDRIDGRDVGFEENY